MCDRFFEQGRETDRKKKKPSSKKRYDEQPQESINSHRDVSRRGPDAEDRTSPVSHHRDSVPSDRRRVEGDRKLLGPLPSLSPQSTSRSRSHRDSDQPAESYRRLTEDENGSRYTDQQQSDKPNGSAFPGHVDSSAGRLAPIGQLDPQNTG